MELARVGHDDLGPEVGEVTADPRAVGAGFQREGGAGKLGEQRFEGGPGVGQGRLAHDCPGGIKDADVMRTITQIEAEGVAARNNGGGRGGGYDGRSFRFGFHKAVSLTHRLTTGLCLLI